MTLYYPITAPYPVFTDIDGMPLENGYIYVGLENQNPITNPITVYWDRDLQYPAGQPIRTLAGSPCRNGAPSPIYTSAPYSLLIKNKNGVQIYYSLSSGILDLNANDDNLVIDGDFQLPYQDYQYNGTAGDPEYSEYTWIYTNSGLDYEVALYLFDIDQTDVPNNPKRYMQILTQGISAASDFFRVSYCIEDLFTTYGLYLTLSFYARITPGAGLTNDTFSTSFTIKETNAIDRTTGINVQKHSLTEEWQKFTTTFQVPEITTEIEPYPNNQESSLILNIWANAGSDYDIETNGLGHTAADVAIEIADIRIERGSIATQFQRKPISDTYQLYERRYESSYDKIFASGEAGWLTYIASGVNNFIPGFQFRQKKRTSGSTITICSADTGDADKVYLAGSGDIAVTSVGDISYFGCGQINLGAATAGNNVYYYHYIVNDELTI